MKDTIACLTVQNLTKKIDSATIFKGVSFQLHPGEWLGLVGKNGSGKSTLASLLVGLDHHYMGEIKLNGDNQKQISEKKWVQNVQLISQYSRNALDPTKSIYELLKEPLKQFRLAEKAEYLSKILEVLKASQLTSEILEKKPRQLSGGQYQRVCIAQALLVQPKILICDEITANLDKITELKILELLKKNRKLAVIFISHDQNLLDIFCHSILSIEHYHNNC